MTTPARAAEADRVEAVYYWALNMLGSAVTVDSLALWATVPASSQAASAGWWLSESIDLLTGFRGIAHELALTYYRLVRALRTGYTVALPNEEAGSTVSLEKLRDDFEGVVNEIERETVGASSPNWGEDPEATYDDEPPLELGDDEDLIEVEYIFDTDTMIDDLNEAATEEAATNLDALGIENMLGQLEDDSDEQAADDAHAAAGARQAAAAERIMLNASRGLVYNLGDSDLRVIGWVRFSKTGDPCAWCAMLISRGIAYKTRKQASGKSGNAESVRFGNAQVDDQYHDNCHCVAVPIFAPEQFADNPIYETNRKLDALWKREIRGKFSGTDALAAWRRLFRYGSTADRQRATPSTPAQEAA